MSRRLFELILAIKRKCQCTEEEIQAELGISPAEFNGLIVLDGGRELLGCEFARQMGLSPSRGSRVLNAMVAHGYVTTQSRPDDRRAIGVRLTAKGRRTKAKIAERMGRCEQRVVGRLDRRRRTQVMQALELLETVL